MHITYCTCTLYVHYITHIGKQPCYNHVPDQLALTVNNVLIIYHNLSVDLVSAPFCESKKQIYDGIEDPDTFFRPSLRSLLVS